MKRLLTMLPLLALLCSCGNKIVFDESRTFERNVWNNFKPEVFDIDISNTDDYYNIYADIVVDTAIYRYDELPLIISLTTPDNERRMFQTVVRLRKNGNWLGERIDGRRVFSKRIREYFCFNTKGVQHMEVRQSTSQYDLEGMKSLRVYVEKTKISYDDL